MTMRHSDLSWRDRRRRRRPVLEPFAWPAAGAAAAAATPARLTNLAHLDFLGDRSTPPAQAGHTTYRLAHSPRSACCGPTPTARTTAPSSGSAAARTTPATDTYGQGAFNADDIARAAVVYLRHWRQTGDAPAATRAYEMLRGLTYLQTATGPERRQRRALDAARRHAQPAAPSPSELPDPSDSDASYWLARTVWALGEGYAAFRSADPAFAAFLATGWTWRSARSTGRCSTPTAATGHRRPAAPRPG